MAFWGAGGRPQQQMGGSMGMQPQRQMMQPQGGPSNTMMRSGGIGPSPGMQQQRFIPPSQRPGGVQQPYPSSGGGMPWNRQGSLFAQQNPNMSSVSRQQMPGYAGGITTMDMVRNPYFRGGGQSLNPEYGMNRGGQQPQTGIGPSQGPVMPPQDWAEDFLRRNPGDEHRLASAYRSELKY